MFIPLTIPLKSSPNGAEPALPSALAWLGSSDFYLLELQGKLEVSESGNKHRHLVDHRKMIDDTNDGQVLVSCSLLPQSSLTSVPYLGYET
jgi:hypothetical protein